MPGDTGTCPRPLQKTSAKSSSLLGVTPMKNVDDCILRELIGLSRHFNRFYCFPAQHTILRCLSNYHGVKISGATLNRHLDNLEADGFFERVRRFDQTTRKFMSTLYKLLPRAIYYLKRLGWFLKSVGGNVFDFLKADKKKAQAAAQASNALSLESPPLSYDEGRVRWKELLSSLG